MIIIAMGILVFVLLVTALIHTDPAIDYIEIEGKQKRILWYYNLQGERTWIFLWNNPMLESTLLVIWFICLMIVWTVCGYLLSAPDTLLNIIGAVLGFIFVAVSIKSKFFTSVINK